jgi:gluconate 5-dehydrogenase
VSSHRLVKNALPFLLKASRKNGGSSVINIASMYGIISPDLSIYSSADNSNPPYYGAAKAALIQWTRYAACEFANKGIRFNSISPGAFPGVEAQKNHVLMNNIRSKIPLNRIGDPKDLLGVIILLSSHLSSYITGSNIVIDGGWTAL